MANPNKLQFDTIEALFEHDLLNRNYQRALCEDFSFLDNFAEEDNVDD